jgi:hypothetical protein
MRTSTRHLLIGIGAAVVAACLGVHPVRAQDTGNAPPPPAVEFKKEPEVILIPQSRVYYVPELKYDLFRYGRYWYINNDGYWYRARSHRGPFTNVDYNRIPRSIVRVPAKYHKQPLQSPAAARSAIRRDVDDAVKRTIGTRRQPSPGAGQRKPAMTRPQGSKAQPTRKTWDRSGQGTGKKPPPKIIKKKTLPKRQTPATMKKRPPSSTQRKAPAAAKKPAPSGAKKPASSPPKRSAKKSPPKKTPQKTKK